MVEGKKTTGRRKTVRGSKSKSPLTLVEEALKSIGYAPQRVGGVDAYVVDFDDPFIEGGLAQLITSEGRFVFYLDFKDKVPQSAQNAVAEFITRANSGLIIGNFEFSYEVSILRFKTSIDFEGSGLTGALVKNMVSAACKAIDVYGEAAVSVMSQKKSPAQAATDAESAAD